MATSAKRPLAVARGGRFTRGRGPEGHRSGPEKRRMPRQNGAMRCRHKAPETKRCAVGQNETMRCRFAPRHHILTEAERVCPECGCLRADIGVDKSEQLDYHPASLFVIEHFVHKYACPCCSQRCSP